VIVCVDVDVYVDAWGLDGAEEGAGSKNGSTEYLTSVALLLYRCRTFGSTYSSDVIVMRPSLTILLVFVGIHRSRLP
jgi:hypothetical protein